MTSTFIEPWSPASLFACLPPCLPARNRSAAGGLEKGNDTGGGGGGSGGGEEQQEGRARNVEWWRSPKKSKTNKPGASSGEDTNSTCSSSSGDESCKSAHHWWHWWKRDQKTPVNNAGEPAAERIPVIANNADVPSLRWTQREQGVPRARFWQRMPLKWINDVRLPSEAIVEKLEAKLEAALEKGAAIEAALENTALCLVLSLLFKVLGWFGFVCFAVVWFDLVRFVLLFVALLCVVSVCSILFWAFICCRGMPFYEGSGVDNQP